MLKLKQLKHKYRVNGITTVFYIQDGELERTVTIDTKDLLKVLKYKWRITKDGYVRNTTVGFLHRYVTNCPESKVVDHISHNKLNNTSLNLRICTASENQHNRLGANKNNNTTGFRGISFNKKSGEFIAMVSLQGIKHYVGTFMELEEAKRAVIKKRTELTSYCTADLNPNKEFINHKEAKTLKDNSNKVSIPPLKLDCCGIRFSTNNLKDHKLFRLFLNFPTKETRKNEFGNQQKVLFEFTYRFICPKQNCIKFFVYSYGYDYKLFNFSKITGKTAIAHFNVLSSLMLKELSIPDPALFRVAAASTKHGWVYGVNIDDGIFEAYTLDDAPTGRVVPVGKTITSSLEELSA